MKYTLEFFPDRPEDYAAFKRAIKAQYSYQALREIAEQVFRPHRKWGYGTTDGVLNTEHWSEETFEVVGALEKMFYTIINEHELNIWED